MNSEKNIDVQLEELARAVASKDSFVQDVMSRIETSSDKPQKQSIKIYVVRRFFMKNTFKLAAAAAIILGALGGLHFLSPSGSNGVVWADVVQRVRQANAFSYQMQLITTGQPLPDANSLANMDATIWIAADNRMKMEIKLKGLHSFTSFLLPDQKKMVYVWPETKMYLEIELVDEAITQKYLSDMKQKDPREWVQDVVNSQHQSIGKTIIDGVEVEGLETTNPAIPAGGSKKTFSRLWVNVETGYPVQLESEEDLNDGKTHRRSVIHNFQWYLDANAAGIEPNIPSDYTALPKGQMKEYTNDGKTRVSRIGFITPGSQQNPDATAASEPNIPSEHTAMPKPDEPSAIAGLRTYLELTDRYPDDLNVMTLVNGMLPAIKAMGDKILVENFNLDPNQLKGLSQEEVAKKVQEFCTNQYKGLSPEEAAKKAQEFLPKSAQLQKQAEDMMKKSKAWSESIQSLAMFYMTLVQQVKDPAYYGKTVTPGDAKSVLLRWKTSDTTYKVIMGDLSITEMSSEQLKQIEPQPDPLPTTP